MSTYLVFSDENLTEMTCYANSNNICISIKDYDHPLGMNIMLDLETSKNFLNHMISQIELFENFKNNSNE